MSKLPHTEGSNGIPFSPNPILKAGLSPLRSSIVLFLLFIAFISLLGRAFWLQAMTKDFLHKQGEIRYARTIELPATRGKILDRDGQVLASSLPVKAIWAIPEDVLTSSKEQIQSLAILLNMPSSDLYKKLRSDKTFVYLKRQVEVPIADAIMALHIPGVETRKEYKRYYPQGETVSHIVGFTNVEDIGQDGIELQNQKNLAGISGSRRVIKDRLGRTVEDISAVVEPRDGADIRLSLDSNIQYIAFTKLKDAVEKSHAKAGGIIVLDTKTGEVLALANLPSYNPNDRAGLTGAQLRNRVLTDTFEPGSTLKPFSVSLALNEHVVTPDTLVDTSPGKIRIGSATISDSHAHGILTVAQVIQKSSNIGTTKIALKLQPEDMWTMFTQVGFGIRPQVEFPGAVAGRLRPFKNWRPIEQATMSYGHGISVSLLQLASAYLVFARQGDIIPVSFKKIQQAPSGTLVFSPQTVAQMRNMLETVVSAEGTAPKAAVEGYRVGGKTGTAYKIVNGRYVNNYVASFVGIAPMSNPRVIVAVMVDEPLGGHFGGDVAAPVFSEVTGSIMRAMNITPDAPVTVTPDKKVDTLKMGL